MDIFKFGATRYGKEKTVKEFQRELSVSSTANPPETLITGHGQSFDERSQQLAAVLDRRKPSAPLVHGSESDEDSFSDVPEDEVPEKCAAALDARWFRFQRRKRYAEEQAAATIAIKKARAAAAQEVVNSSLGMPANDSTCSLLPCVNGDIQSARKVRAPTIPPQRANFGSPLGIISQQDTKEVESLAVRESVHMAAEENAEPKQPLFRRVALSSGNRRTLRQSSVAADEDSISFAFDEHARQGGPENTLGRSPRHTRFRSVAICASEDF